MKIDIFGSCVTRDSFKYTSNVEYKVNNYFARSSIVSLYGRIFKIKIDDIKLASAFQRKMVYFDLTKEFPRHIKSFNSDYLIIDFIDERMNILKTKESYLTRSKEFVESKIDIKGRVLSDSDKLMLWEKCAERFINDLKSNLKPEQIILHKAFWQEQYKGEDGTIHKFDDPEIKINNLRLKHYYEMIENGIEGINVIELNGFIADENHVWGLSPFHYEDRYYLEFINQLDSIVENV
jgi:hypothetical protein